MVIDLSRAIAESVESALRALELGSSARLRGPEIGVVLEEALSLDVARFFGPLPTLRQRISLPDEVLRASVVSRIEAALASIDARFVHELSAHPQIEIEELALEALLLGQHGRSGKRFALRIAQRAFERVIGERVAPALRVRWPEAMSAGDVAEVLPGRVTHAIIVGELIGAVEEFYPLIVDAYSNDLRCCGEVTLNVIGVHDSWLNESGRATRLIHYNHATRELYEAELEVPLEFDSCQFLYLGRDETRRHEALSLKLRSVKQVNSFEVSRHCDDKFRTAVVLSQQGLRSPKSALISQAQLGQLSEVLEQAGLATCRSVVVQPNRGTEGADTVVLALDAPDEDLLTQIETHVLNLAEHGVDQVIIRERIEGLRLAADEVSFATTIRINVCWDGHLGHSESAYLQVAGWAEPEISSVGRGGSVATLSSGILEKLRITSDELSLVRCAASAAVAAVVREVSQPEPVGLFGVDVLLERNGEGSFAWILEINARPAGLSHSDLLDTCEPGVSTVLFETLLKRAMSTCDCGSILREGAAARAVECKLTRETNRGQCNTAS